MTRAGYWCCRGAVTLFDISRVAYALSKLPRICLSLQTLDVILALVNYWDFHSRPIRGFQLLVIRDKRPLASLVMVAAMGLNLVAMHWITSKTLKHQ